MSSISYYNGSQWVELFRGPAGVAGAVGATGPAGPGVPTGGVAGQVLQKNSDTNYDTVWATPSVAFSETDAQWTAWLFS